MEVFCSDRKKSHPNRIFPSGWSEKRSEMTIEYGLETTIDSDDWTGILWLPVNVSSLNLSLFLAFHLHSNVDSGRYCFVVQNWRIPPQNGYLLAELSNWIEESFFPCKMTWFATPFWSFARTLGYFVFSSVLHCLTSTVHDTTPEGVLS